MPRKVSKKGRSYEKECSRLISELITGGITTEAVWYTAGSGSKNKRKVNLEKHRFDYGDLRPALQSAEEFFNIFSVECKSGYTKVIKKKGNVTKTNWAILDIFDSKQAEPIFFTFWGQACDDAKDSDRRPILIFRRSSRSSCIAMEAHMFLTIQEYINIRFLETNIINRLQLKYDNKDIIICNLDEFITKFAGKFDNGFYVMLEKKGDDLKNENKGSFQPTNNGNTGKTRCKTKATIKVHLK